MNYLIHKLGMRPLCEMSNQLLPIFMHGSRKDTKDTMISFPILPTMPVFLQFPVGDPASNDQNSPVVDYRPMQRFQILPEHRKYMAYPVWDHLFLCANIALNMKYTLGYKPQCLQQLTV